MEKTLITKHAAKGKFGKYHISTHAYVHAGKEFAWFQSNEKTKYLYPVLDNSTKKQCCLTRKNSINCSVSTKSACSSSKSPWNHGCIMGLFTKPRISDSTFVAPWLGLDLYDLFNESIFYCKAFERVEIFIHFCYLKKVVLLQRLFSARVCQIVTVTAYKIYFYSNHHKLKLLCEKETQ